MSREAHREALVSFLETIRRPEVPAGAIAASENLVEAGLIDSLAVLEVVLFLEREFGIDFASTGVDPGQLYAVSSILDLIERHAALKGEPS